METSSLLPEAYSKPFPERLVIVNIASPPFLVLSVTEQVQLASVVQLSLPVMIPDQVPETTTPLVNA